MAERQPIPDDVDFKTWINDRPDDMPVRATRALPGMCPTPLPAALTPLEQLLAPLEGDLNPLHGGATLPASVTNDDRLISQFYKGSVGIW
eukprot:2138940-Pyramimonas_sp.AAC.1